MNFSFIKLLIAVITIIGLQANTYAQMENNNMDMDIKMMLKTSSKKIGDNIYIDESEIKAIDDNLISISKNTPKNGNLFIFLNNCEVNPELGRYIENIVDSASQNQVKTYIVIANAKGLANVNAMKSFASKINDQLRGRIPIIIDHLSKFTFSFSVNEVPSFFYLDKLGVIKNKGSFFIKSADNKFFFKTNIQNTCYKSVTNTSIEEEYPCSVVY